MKRIRLIIAFLLAVAIFASTAMAAEVTTAVESIGGRDANVIYIRPTATTYIAPILADHTVSGDTDASQLIAESGGQLVAAMNGTFFNCYYNSSVPKDFNTGNYPRIYSAIVKDGKMINSGGGAAIGVDYDGNIKIGRVNLVAVAKLGGTPFYAWGVNTAYTDSSAIYVLTEELGLSVDVASHATIVEVSNGRVVNMLSGRNNYHVPQGCTAVVIGGGYGTRGVKIGDSAQYYFEDRNGDSSWKNMRNIIGGSGLIVENGCVAVDNNPNVTAEDQAPDLVSQRTFAAVLSDGRLMLGAVTSSYRAIAETLIQKGATDAMFFDGGASTLLYASGKQLVPAGRRLASLLGVFDTTGSTATQPAATQTTGVSAWAASDVSEAKKLGIMPASLDSQHQKSITRGEFCQLVSGYVEAITGLPIEQFMPMSSGLIEWSGFFTDTQDSDILHVARIGVVNGYPDGTFRPNDSIKRQDAAIMLCRLAETMGAEALGGAKVFSDSGKISDYAKSGVDFVTALEIMNGHANGTFAPMDPITREQAVVTIMNTWRNL